MSTVLNDLILTDASGFAVGDTLTPGAGLSDVADSGVLTAWTDPSVLAQGDQLYLSGTTGTVSGLSTLEADVTYVDAAGDTVTGTMSLVVVQVTDNATGAVSQMLLPMDSSGNLMQISAITITATDTTPDMTQVALADIQGDDTVSLDFPGQVDGTEAAETIDGSYIDADGDGLDGNGNRIEANGGDDVVLAGTGNDTVFGGDGQDQLFGGDGDDVMSGNAGDDTLFGQGGDDTLFGNEGDDKLVGGEGDDLLIGGAGNNLMYGDDLDGDTGGWSPGDTPEPGFGNDTMIMGNGDDTAFGGSGDDVFQVFDNFGNHQITGGEAGEVLGDKINATQMTQDTSVIYTGDEQGTMSTGSQTATFSEIERVHLGSGDDRAEVITSTTGFVHGGSGFDTLVLPDPAPGEPAPVVTVTDEIDNGDGTTSKTGYVDFPDGTRLEFESFEEIICFTPGTLIDTLRGRVAVEELAPGDQVLTRDHGYQPLAWTGRRDLSAAELAACPAVAPVRIAAGALGKDLPERDLIVSPRHRMLVTGARAELMFGEREVLVAAGDLMGLPGVSRVTEGAVSYIHVMCETHQILRAEGSWTESFQPAEAVINALGAETRSELLGLFPELATEAGRAGYAAARPVLNGAEARSLFAA